MANTFFNRRGFVDIGTTANAQLGALQLERLPPFLRALLVTDGTVTKILEAYFWEAIAVEVLSQTKLELASDLPFIETKAGETVVKRAVLLRGERSDHIYAYADSYFKIHQGQSHGLDAQLADELLAGHIGIGELLREMGLETFREIKDLGREQYQQAQEAIYRTYVISVDGSPTIQITEHFPLARY